MDEKTTAENVNINISAEKNNFYGDILRALNNACVDFLVGGGFSFTYYTGMEKPIKDLDIFVRQAEVDRILSLFRQAGLHTELTFPHWLAKIDHDCGTVDVIFNSGNGIGKVDDQWFENARTAHVLGVPVNIVPPEEMIWQKAWICERERFDGGDVAHLLHACAPALDWDRLVARFGEHWRVLLVHLVLFEYIYPDERKHIPTLIYGRLLDRLQQELAAQATSANKLCRGTLLSREQYLVDIHQRGFLDARLVGGYMTCEDIERWTLAIGK